MKRLISTMLLSVFICGFLAVAFSQPDVMSPTGSGYTWFVDDDNPSSEPPWCNSIQQAIDRATAGNDILVWPGNYSKDQEKQAFIFNGKDMIQLHAQDPNNKPELLDRIELTNSKNIIIQNLKLTYSGYDNPPLGTISASRGPGLYGFTIENCDFVRSGNVGYGISTNINVTVTNCTFKSYKAGIIVWSGVYGGAGANINNCYLESCTDGIFFDASSVLATPEGSINATVTNTQFKYVGGFFAHAPLTANSTRGDSDPNNDVPITVNLVNIPTPIWDNPLGFNQLTWSAGTKIEWRSRACSTCPTFFNTPNYPSNYPNNANSDGVLNAPGTGGYYVVVNGKTESSYDKLYIREMNGTLITTVSGTKTNYKKWINTARSVKLQFTSDGAVNYKGYTVTVQ